MAQGARRALAGINEFVLIREMLWIREIAYQRSQDSSQVQFSMFLGTAPYLTHPTHLTDLDKRVPGLPATIGQSATRSDPPRSVKSVPIRLPFVMDASPGAPAERSRRLFAPRPSPSFRA